MAGVHGERLYGQVDRVPGVFYVSTMFWHMNYIPFVPLRSFVVLEGSEQGDAFQGKRVSLRWKSVLVGYLRGWLGAVAVFSAGVAGFAGTAFFLRHTDWPAILAGIAVAGALGWCFWFILATERPIYFWIQTALLVLSVAFWFACNWAIEQNPALAQAKAKELAYFSWLLVANLAALLCNLTRLLTTATQDRALALAEELGLSPEIVSAYLAIARGLSPEEAALAQRELDQAQVKRQDFQA